MTVPKDFTRSMWVGGMIYGSAFEYFMKQTQHENFTSEYQLTDLV